MNEDSPIIKELYDEFYKDVYHFSLYFTNKKQDAEDITQETFIKVLKNIDQLKDLTKKKPWILSIARNTAIDLMRKQKLHHFLSKKMMEQQLHSNDDYKKDRLINAEIWKELQLALLKLKPHYRSVVILRALNDLSIKETAEALKCKEEKVRVDFHRALKQLKKGLNLKEGWQYDEETT